MRCAEVVERLVAPDVERGAPSAGVGQHLATCANCASLGRRLARLDEVLGATLLVEAPADLQRRLAALVEDAGRAGSPAPADRAGPREAAGPWWVPLRRWLDGLGLRPNVAVAQGLATMMLVLAGWQVFGWLSAVGPVLGDVPYAMALVVGSPAAAYVGFQQGDLSGLGTWLLVGASGWLLSESSPIVRRLGVRLPLS